jgi:hypothetical protein
MVARFEAEQVKAFVAARPPETIGPADRVARGLFRTLSGSGGLTDHFHRDAWRPKHFIPESDCPEMPAQRPVIKPDGLEPATVASAASFS